MGRIEHDVADGAILELIGELPSWLRQDLASESIAQRERAEEVLAARIMDRFANVQTNEQRHPVLPLG